MNNLFELILPLVSFLIIFLFCRKFLPTLFPIVKSTHRSAMQHGEVMRGVGILFPVCIFIYFFFFNFDLNFFFKLSFITSVCVIGYLDDLKNFSHKLKILLLTIIFLIHYYFDNSITLESEYYSLNLLFISFLFYIFFVLFFNQIDGINGLSSGTGLVYILISFYLFVHEEKLIFYWPIIGTIFSYFIINILFGKPFQGDSGAYFIGVCAYITAIDSKTNFLLTLILLNPILMDVFWTTLMRIYFKFNLSIPHKNHFYQKSVTKLKKHFPITILYMSFQILIGLIIYFFFSNLNIFNQFLILILTGIILSIFFFPISYNLNKKSRG